MWRTGAGSTAAARSTTGPAGSGAGVAFGAGAAATGTTDGQTTSDSSRAEAMVTPSTATLAAPMMSGQLVTGASSQPESAGWGRVGSAMRRSLRETGTGGAEGPVGVIRSLQR